jgi:hypothetical protein
MHLMVLLGVRLKWKLDSVPLEIVLILTHNRCARFAPNIPLAQKSFYTHPRKLLGDVGNVESHFGLVWR